MGLRGDSLKRKFLKRPLRNYSAESKKKKKAHGGVVVGGLGNSTHNEYDVGQIHNNGYPKELAAVIQI